MSQADNLAALGTNVNSSGVLAIASGGTGSTTSAGALTNLGAYPSTNPNGYTSNTGTVTSVNLTGGTAISVSGGPITSSGSITVNNTGVTSIAAGTGISVNASTGGVTVTNSAPNQLTTTTGSPAYYGARAWVNFNGTTNTGGFCTVRASVNVSSVADNGVGDYTINFTTAMPDANYSAIGMVDAPAANIYSICIKFNVAPTTTAVRVSTGLVGTAFADVGIVNVSIFR